jgi:hypothetical protein
MIRAETEQGRRPGEGLAYVIHYATPKSEGSRRFGGYNAREKATLFAVQKLSELRDT